MKYNNNHYKYLSYLLNISLILVISLIVILSYYNLINLINAIILFIIVVILIIMNIYLFKISDEARLNEAIKISQQKRENFNKIAGTLAHEIRNPLSTILVNIDLLHEKINKQKYDELWFGNKIKILKKEVARLNNILENFLDIARGKKLQLKKTLLNKIIEDILNLEIDKVFQINKNIKFRLDLCDYDVYINCDEVQLKQALLNLIKNAEEALEDTGGGEIIIKCFERNKKAHLYIIDTGKGINPEKLNKIFEIYFTTKEKGNGLGIPVANRIIEQHGGYLKINSYENKGTFIEISLPIDHDEPTE